MQPRLIITRANGKCVIDTNAEEDKAIMITVVPALPHDAFCTVGALNEALERYLKDKSTKSCDTCGNPCMERGTSKTIYCESWAPKVQEQAEKIHTNSKFQCRTCENKNCEYYDIRENMSAGKDRQTGWRASPAVITFAVGCLSHSAIAARERAGKGYLDKDREFEICHMEVVRLRSEWFSQRKALIEKDAEIIRLGEAYRQLQMARDNIAVSRDRALDQINSQAQEITQLKSQITGYHEAIEVLRESKDKEIAKLKQHFDDAQREIQALQHEGVRLKDRIAQQDHELKDLGDALRRVRSEEREAWLKALKDTVEIGLPDQEHVLDRVRLFIKEWGGSARQKEPPKDEPELVICPLYDKSKCVCVHGEPHKHSKECDGHKDTTEGYCGASCIPYKKEPTVPQEPDRPCQACIEGNAPHCSKPFPDCPYYGDPEPVPKDGAALEKDIGDLTLRMDKLESRFEEVTNNFVNGMDEGFGLRDCRILKAEDRVKVLETALKSLKEEVAAIPRPPKDRENYYEIDLGPGFEKIYISKNSVYPVPDQDAGGKKE